MCDASCVAQRRPARAAQRQVFCKLCGMEQRAELLVVLGASCAHDATQMSRSIPFTSQTSTCTNSSPQLSSLSAKLCHSMSLVLKGCNASTHLRIEWIPGLIGYSSWSPAEDRLRVNRRGSIWGGDVAVGQRENRLRNKFSSFIVSASLSTCRRKEEYHYSV